MPLAGQADQPGWQGGVYEKYLSDNNVDPLHGCTGREDDLSPEQKRSSAQKPQPGKMVRRQACDKPASAGCGGGEDAARLDPKLALARKPYFEQKVDWQPCDKARLTRAYEKMLTSPRLRCANIRAPMDWDHPASGDITVAVTRLAVKDPAKRTGALLFNPGGPGGDGILENLEFYAQFARKGAASSATSLEQQVIAQYDLIGFSPRGLGSSTHLKCGSSDRLSTVLWASDSGDPTVDALLRNAELKSKACQRSPLAPYINTEQIARDMDLIRALSGDAKLNYIGTSYGTWLGAWYAGLFPERTGRMVLSANVDFSAHSYADAGILHQPPAIQRIVEQIIVPYTARHDAHFGLGTSPEAISQLFAALPPALKTATSLALSRSNVFSLPGYIDEGASAFVAAKGVQQMLRQNPSATEAQILALAKHWVFSRHSLANQMALKVATLTLIPAYFEATQAGPLNDDALLTTTEEAVDLAVVCNDMPALSTNRQFWIDKHKDYARRYPLGSNVLGGSVLNFSCLFWKPPKPVVIKPTIEQVARAPSIVMIQTQFDGLTPAEGALRMFDRLPNASLLYVKDDYAHIGYPQGNPCVDEPVTRYLLDGTRPPRRTECHDNGGLWLDSGHELTLD